MGRLHRALHILSSETPFFNITRFCKPKPRSVLRRRFQVNTMSGLGYKYKGLWDAITVIIKGEGVRGLYKGLLPNLLKVAPSIGSSFLSYEITRDLLTGLVGGI